MEKKVNDQKSTEENFQDQSPQTDFTVEDIQRAIAEEERLGPRKVPQMLLS